MRLVITVPWKERLGGAEAMLHTFLRHHDTRRFDTTVVFYEPGPFQAEVAALDGIRTELVPIRRLRDGRAVAQATTRLTRLLRREQPDVVLNWVAKAQLYGSVAAAAAGLKDRVVWWQHGVPHGHWMDRLATALPARAIGCSSTAAARAQSQTWPHRETFVVHPGIEVRSGRPIAHADLGIPDGRTVLGIVGRLQPWKGQHRFLDALAALVSDGHDVHGVIVGGDAHGLAPEYPAQLRERAAELGVSGRVTMTGHVADATDYIATMDILVSASENEPFGIVLLEGMAQRKPVVAVADAGPVDIVEPGVTGMLIERPDADLLTDALRQMLGEPDRTAALAEAGYQRLCERFTAVAMSHNLEETLARFATRGEPAGLAR